MLRRAALFTAITLSASIAFGEDSGPALDRIAFGSCNREYKPQPLWNAIRQCKPDLWVWLGDIVYGKATDLADLSRRYAIEKKFSDYKALRQQCRVIGVWDDNDYGVSDGGSENPNKVQSQQLLLDFLDEPADSPRRKQAGVYTSYVFGPPGKRVKVILLDGRYFRQSPGAHSDMLGDEQWNWLERQLTAADADVTLIGSGIQVVADQHPFEKWADFPQSRKRLFDLIASSKARNVILLSGDRHFGEISRLTDPRFPQPIYDITSSGMTHHATDSIFHSFTHEKNSHRVGNTFVDLNFGLVTFLWDDPQPSAKLEIRDASNVVRIMEKVALTNVGSH